MGPRLLILSEKPLEVLEQLSLDLGFDAKRSNNLLEALSALGVLVNHIGADAIPDKGRKPRFELKDGGKLFYDIVVSELGETKDSDDPFNTVNGIELLRAVRLFFGRQVFFLFHCFTVCNPHTRWKLFQNQYVAHKSEVFSGGGGSIVLSGCNMISTDRNEIEGVLRQIADLAKRPSSETAFHCPWCGLANFDELGLWRHCPLYHCNEPNSYKGTRYVAFNGSLFDGIGTEMLYQYKPSLRICPVCGIFVKHKMQVHIFHAHGASGRENFKARLTQGPQCIAAFSLVVCCHKDHILLVQECANSGYWLPGGRVEDDESLENAAVRETEEEAGVKVTLTGILKLQYHGECRNVRMRAIFMAEPADPLNFPRCKTFPNYESCGAAWVPIKEVLHDRLRLRGPEPYNWLKYLVGGGVVHSLDILSDEEK